MAVVASHAVKTFTLPVNRGNGTVDANEVRSNDNLLRQAYVAHDADPTIHIQSGTLANRPASLAEGSTYFCTDTQDTYTYTGGAWVQTAWAHWYGDFYDTTDQAITTANTAQLVTLNSTGVTRGTSRSNGSRVNVSYAGDYNIMFSVQFRNASADEQDAYLWLKKNGTNIADTAGRVTIPKKHGSEDGHSIAAWNVYATLAANDYVELYVQASSTDVTVETIAAAGSVSRSPSVILTINRI